MRRSIGFGLLCAVLLVIPLLSACTLGHASMVRRDQQGGVLALHGHQGAAMEDAQQQMAAHCGGNYAIVAEEQVVVGEQTNTGEETDYGERNTRRGTRGSESTRATTTTTNITEYHVTYQCGGGAPMAAQQGPPPGQPPPPQQPPPAGEPQAQPAY